MQLAKNISWTPIKRNLEMKKPGCCLAIYWIILNKRVAAINEFCNQIPKMSWQGSALTNPANRKKMAFPPAGEISTDNENPPEKKKMGTSMVTVGNDCFFFKRNSCHHWPWCRIPLSTQLVSHSAILWCTRCSTCTGNHHSNYPSPAICTNIGSGINNGAGQTLAPILNT